MPVAFFFCNDDLGRQNHLIKISNSPRFRSPRIKLLFRNLVRPPRSYRTEELRIRAASPHLRSAMLSNRVVEPPFPTAMLWNRRGSRIEVVAISSSCYSYICKAYCCAASALIASARRFESDLLL